MIENWQEIDDGIVALTGVEPRVTTKGEHIHTCPFCDKPGHLYVNYEKGVFNCYSCGGTSLDSHGGIWKLAEFLGVEIETEYQDIPREVLVQTDMELLESYAQAAGLAVKHDIMNDEMPVQPPPGWELLVPANYKKYFNVMSYLYSRGLSNIQIDFYKIGVAHGGTKIVFPDFNAYGHLRWWQTRAPGKAWGPKYAGPDGATKGGKIGNYYKAVQQTWYVGVAEGPISAIVAGFEFTWLWGKEHSPEQVGSLARLNKPIVIALDGEAKAFGNAMKLARDLRDVGVPVFIVPMPGQHDPASMGTGPFRALLQQTLAKQQGSDLDFLERVVKDYV